MDTEIKFSIDEKLIENFDNEALQEVVNQSQIMANKLINEAVILEATRRKGVGKPIVRKLDVTEAILFPQIVEKMGNKKPWWKKLLHGIIPVLSLIPGIIYNNHTVLTDLVCIFVIVVVVLLTIYLIGD